MYPVRVTRYPTLSPAVASLAVAIALGCATHVPVDGPPAPEARMPIPEDHAELILFRRSAAFTAAATKQIVFPVPVEVNGVGVGSVGNRDCLLVAVPAGLVEVGPAQTFEVEAGFRYLLVGVPRVGLMAPGVSWRLGAIGEEDCRDVSSVTLLEDG
jgi:hypothetical protein